MNEQRKQRKERMPAKYFSITKKANKQILKLPLRIQNKIDKAYSILKENPISGEKLKGELSEYYKFRVGDYRIVYSFDVKKSKVTIVKIEHRQGVYR